MEEFEASHTTPLPGANGGEQASSDRRFAGIRQAARSGRMNAKRVNGDATGARLIRSHSAPSSSLNRVFY